MTRNTWLIFGAVVVLLFGGLIYLSSKDDIDVSKVNTNSVLPATEASGNIGDRVFGNKEAKVVLIEYGDYQCPGCGGAYQKLKDISEKYKDDMAFVFRNYPLTSIHPNARAAAAAAEAAGQLGKYWEMHDRLYGDQAGWQEASGTERTDTFVGYAAELGLKEDAFRKALNDQNKRINQKINFDLALGKKDGVTGTPTILLNGTTLTEGQTQNVIQGNGSELEKLIEAELKKK